MLIIQPVLLLLAGLTVVHFISPSDAITVMSIDLGGEYMKVAIVKPGIPMEIVLDKESSRKTRTIVAFRDEERHFSSLATTTGERFPPKAFQYLTHLVGKHYEDPQVALYRQRFPYYTLVKDEERGTVLFQTQDGEVYSPEELLAMILDHARENAEAFAEQPIQGAVITVPAYFNQAERRAILAAAKLIDLNVIHLMSDNAAVALNYGVFRRKNFNSTTQYYIFYDMGASSTTASVVAYQVVKMKDGSRTETNPQLTIKGVGFDRSLGGLEMSLRLRNHLAKAFNEQKKTTNDIFKNNRAMAKLLKEANRVKQVLSANVDHHAQVEGLLDEKDFRFKVTRTEFEDLCADLFERVTKPIEDALRISEVTLGEVSEVILFGGSTRVPKVQEILMQYLNRSDLGKSLNTDEASALGAVYQAAYSSKGFKVKRFNVREGNIYPIVVEFDRQKSSEDSDKDSRRITRQLFGRMNPFPQRKVMTFNKHTKDFSFSVSYGDLNFLHGDDQKIFSNQTVLEVSLTGVADALAKHGKDTESKGVKAHFHLDESGLLSVDKVESVFEQQKAEDTQSTWSKLGSAIGGLFGTGEKETEGASDSEGKDSGSETSTPGDQTTTTKTAEKENAKPDSSQGGPSASDQSQEHDEEGDFTKPDGESDDVSKTKKRSGSEDEKKKDGGESYSDSKPEDVKDKKTKTKKDKDSKDKSTDKKTEKEQNNETKSTEDEAAKAVKEVVKEPIKVEAVLQDLPDITKEKLKVSHKRLADLRAKDLTKKELEQAKNDLESFIFDYQTRLEEKDYEKCSTTEEREHLILLLAGASEWMSEQAEDALKGVYQEKLQELRLATSNVSYRVREMTERPKALEALRSMLNHSRHFLVSVKNLTAVEEEPIFTSVEIDMLEKLINETEDWRKTSVKEQKKVPDYENPVLLTEQIALKIRLLEREINYLLNKAKNYRPKTKPKVKVEKNTTKANTTDNDNKTANSGDDQTTEGTDDDSNTTAEPPTDQEATPPTPDVDDGIVESEDQTEAVDDSAEDESQTEKIKKDEHVEL